MAETNNQPWLKNWSSLPAREEEVAPSAPVTDVPPWQKSWTSLSPKEEALTSMTHREAQRAVQGASPSTVSRVASLYRPTQFEKVFDNLIQAESGGRHRSNGRLTTSPVGARGITQVMPKTGEDPGYGIKPLQNDSEQEYRRFGRDYLAAMVNEFDGDYAKAVAAYNAGPASVKKAITRAESKGGRWVDYLPKKSETIPYMKKILGEGVLASIGEEDAS